MGELRQICPSWPLYGLSRNGVLPQELVKCSQLAQHLVPCGFLSPHKHAICKSILGIVPGSTTHTQFQVGTLRYRAIRSEIKQRDREEEAHAHSSATLRMSQVRLVQTLWLINKTGHTSQSALTDPTGSNSCAFQQKIDMWGVCVTDTQV